MDRVLQTICTVMSSNRRLYPSPDSWNPWGARQYLYWPHSVMNVVASRAAKESGRLWYPFHAPRTVFLVLVGKTEAWLNGEEVLWVSLLVAAFKFCTSTMHLGEPSFFGATTVLENQVVGVQNGTGSIIPSATSLSKSCFTRFFQWWGISIGVWIAVGVTPGIKVISNGLPVIVCNGWCGHVLNALASKCFFFLIHCSSWCLLVSVGGNGIVSGLGGTDVLAGHLDGALLIAFIDELIFDTDNGKSRVNKPRPLYAAWDR